MFRRRPRVARRARVAVTASLAALAGGPCSAWAIQTAQLEVSLTPERLGQGTTIEFGFRVSKVGGGVPSPVTRIELRYPKHIGIVTSGLGLASCTQALLETFGGEGCASRSLMGLGTATAQVQVGEELVEEAATTGIYMAPLSGEGINLQFFLNGETPLAAALVFPGRLLPARLPYGGILQIAVPLLESFPQGPYVSLIRLRSTIGPRGVTYYERLHGKFVPYQPPGITLPESCPRGGFPFALTFSFADGTTTTTRERVPCPAPRR